MKGRETVISTGDSFDNLQAISRIPIPDDDIICDLCNAEVDEEPFVCLEGGWVLCSGCRQEVGIKPGQEYE